MNMDSRGMSGRVYPKIIEKYDCPNIQVYILFYWSEYSYSFLNFDSECPHDSREYIEGYIVSISF